MVGDDVPIEEWAGEFSTVASLTPWAEGGIAKANPVYGRGGLKRPTWRLEDPKPGELVMDRVNPD